MTPEIHRDPGLTRVIDWEEACPECLGRGETQIIVRTGTRLCFTGWYEPCTACGGTGLATPDEPKT